jgi:hypothetical protein
LYFSGNGISQSNRFSIEPIEWIKDMENYVIVDNQEFVLISVSFSIVILFLFFKFCINYCKHERGKEDEQNFGQYKNMFNNLSEDIDLTNTVNQLGS